MDGSGAGLTLASAWPLGMVRFEGLLIVFLVGVSRTLGSSGCDLGALSSPGSSIRCACFLHPMLSQQTDGICQEIAPQQDQSAHTEMHTYHRILCYTGGTLRHVPAPQTSAVGLTYQIYQMPQAISQARWLARYISFPNTQQPRKSCSIPDSIIPMQPMHVA